MVMATEREQLIVLLSRALRCMEGDKPNLETAKKCVFGVLCYLEGMTDPQKIEEFWNNKFQWDAKYKDIINDIMNSVEYNDAPVMSKDKLLKEFGW